MVPLTLIPGDQAVSLPDQNNQDASESRSAAIDTGLLALVLLARFHGIATEPEQLADVFAPAATPSAGPRHGDQRGNQDRASSRIGVFFKPSYGVSEREF